MYILFDMHSLISFLAYNNRGKGTQLVCTMQKKNVELSDSHF